MANETKPVGRPALKPKRKMTGFAINTDLIDKVQLSSVKRKESLNDWYNEAIKFFLKHNNHL